jgi:hypothetical protein
MTDELFLQNYDPFGYRDDLRDAWGDEDLHAAGAVAALAAYRLALAQGRCLLYGIETEAELLRPLSPDVVAVAADEMARRLDDWTGEVGHLSERWDEAIDPGEANELCSRPLKFRMDVWAASTAVDRSYLAAPTPMLGQVMDRFNEAVGRFDDALEAQSDVLSTLAGTRLLDNWRAMLAPKYREDLPWWLDGRLEEAARRVEAFAGRTLPGPQAWAEVRRLADGQGRLSVVSTPSESPAWAWFDTLQMMAAGGTSPPPVPQHRDWRCQDSTATLVAVAGQGPSVRVNFYHNGKAARDLAGTTAYLAGVPAVIDRDGNADFDVQQLRQARDAGRPDSLAVGNPSSEWDPIPAVGSES